ncbi:MAG: hypothetical protein WA152_00895 [Microgenomates group bacterium]
MMQFIVLLVVISLMLVEKAFFYSIESVYSKSFIGNFELIVFVSLFIIGIIAFVKDYYHTKNKIKTSNDKKNFLSVFLGLLSVFIVLLSFSLNINKKSIHWDAVALYDARAKFLEGGVKFSEMPNLSQYDNLNKYYYLLYPPYTSIAHFFWNTSVLSNNFPVGTYYSIILVLLLLVIYSSLIPHSGKTILSILVFLTVSNSSIFNIVIKEYTNLPFNLYLLAGIFTLFSFLKTENYWKLFFGVLLVSSSVWVRLLEPIWLIVSLSFMVAMISKKNVIKKTWPGMLILFVSLLGYLSWSYFTKVIAGNPSFLSFSYLTLIDPIVALFTGAPFVVLLTMAKSWGIPFFIHLCTLLALVFRFKEIINDKALLFLGLVLLSSLALYFVQFYMLSFQGDWWSIVTQSLDRSGSFLIPISAYILLTLFSTKYFSK